jgi:hypothetical protein
MAAIVPARPARTSVLHLAGRGRLIGDRVGARAADLLTADVEVFGRERASGRGCTPWRFRRHRAGNDRLELQLAAV